MQAEFVSENNVDDDGRPAGGYVDGTGLAISWQDGPLREQGTDEPAEPNGAFVETVIAAVIQRIEHYQDSEFASDYNANALVNLRGALTWLNKRTEDRLAREVEGTHQK